MGKIDDLRTKLEDWKEDTNEKYQYEQTGTFREAELASTLATINNVIQMIDQIKQNYKIREDYYGTEN